MLELNRMKYNEKWGCWVSMDGRIYRQKSGDEFVEYSRSVTNSGYYQVGLSRGGKAAPRLVHRLVAETFLENPKGLRDVDHINCDRLDNRVSNLRFASHRFNCQRASKNISNERRRRMLLGCIRHHLGRKWFTDGVRNLMLNPGDCPEGFHPGLTKSKKGQGHCKRVPAME